MEQDKRCEYEWDMLGRRDPQAKGRVNKKLIIPGVESINALLSNKGGKNYRKQSGKKGEQKIQQ